MFLTSLAKGKKKKPVLMEIRQGLEESLQTMQKTSRSVVTAFITPAGQKIALRSSFDFEFFALRA